MRYISIDLCEIVDWETFHEVFKQAMGFPEGYGRNMDAWIDCMSDVTTSQSAGLTKVSVGEGEDYVVVMVGVSEFRNSFEELWAVFVTAVVHVNSRKTIDRAGGRLLLLLT